jgi:hypothetical protein
MNEQSTWTRYLRGALGSPIVLFALATALIVLVLVPFFAMANASAGNG